jgi:ubiquinone/menaquinone biosynthesis C-methylase UbiE
MAVKAVILERYKKEASSYDETRREWTQGYPGWVEQRKILGFLKGDSVLEVGTGTGRYMKLLTNNNRNYVGVDLSLRMLKYAKKKLANPSDTKLVCADAEHLPFKEKIFDAVICSRTFRFIPRPYEAMNNIHRVLKKGGRFILSVDFLKDNMFYGLANKIFGKYPYETHYRIDELVDLFQKAGFRVIFKDFYLPLPITFYKHVPRFLWGFLERLDNVLKKWVKGGLSIIVGVKVANLDEGT